MIDKVAVGQRVRSIRLAMGYNKSKFGSYFGATGSLVFKWETGVSLPNPERLSLIAFYGQISVDELLYGKSSAPLIEWIEEQIGDIKLTGTWKHELRAHYNKGYADAMLEVLNHIKLGGKEHE